MIRRPGDDEPIGDLLLAFLVVLGAMLTLFLIFTNHP